MYSHATAISKLQISSENADSVFNRTEVSDCSIANFDGGILKTECLHVEVKN